MRLEPGEWKPPTVQRPDALGLLVIEGLLTRSVRVMDRECPELLGAGDLLRPWDPSSGPLDGEAVWRVLTPVTVAVLDGRFARLVVACPTIVAALLGRATARSRSLCFHRAIGHVRHADTRVLLLLWHLAERWGRVTPDGVALSLPLTHELLAHLAGMRRPTASTALQQLVRSERVVRRGRDEWLLCGSPPAVGDLSAA